VRNILIVSYIYNHTIVSIPNTPYFLQVPDRAQIRLLKDGQFVCLHRQAIDALSTGSDIQFPLKRTNNYEPPNHLEEINR